ncbi:transporter [Gemmobacter aquatilis]|uniref:transporter n=1 Tax=Gemmobacter aquatilis TaxID=933059 RepID=UPI001FE23E6B|nr:transporter [Gemmobacter aquatilis]
MSNSISSLISVPFQYNYDDGFGDGGGQQSYINIQPVIPFSIGANWNLISRTILPVVNKGDFFPGDDSRTGLGNITQSFFFSPKDPTKNGLIWGVGPALQFPTATNDIAPNQWGAGITGVVLKQTNGWTVGMLANHVWSIGNEDTYGESSKTFLQPFVGYTTKRATSFGINTEAQYDWVAEEWSVPINLTVGQIIKVGGKPVQLTGGVRYWADSPPGGPQDWGARLAVTYLFPKG